MTDFTVDEIFEDRRRREAELNIAAKAAKDAAEEAERQRRERTPVRVGNGRIFRP